MSLGTDALYWQARSREALVEVILDKELLLDRTREEIRVLGHSEVCHRGRREILLTDPKKTR